MGLPERIVPEQPAMPVVVFRAGAHCCAISAETVECVIPVVAIDAVPGAPRAVLGIINFHGTVVPVVDPRRRFGERGGELELGQKLILVNTPTRSALGDAGLREGQSGKAQERRGVTGGSGTRAAV